MTLTNYLISALAFYASMFVSVKYHPKAQIGETISAWKIMTTIGGLSSLELLALLVVGFSWFDWWIPIATFFGSSFATVILLNLGLHIFRGILLSTVFFLIGNTLVALYLLN